ncbi:MAG: putative 4-mercaptohistidine N1-methyltransferase [Chthoniobacteraceae bacterium]
MNAILSIGRRRPGIAAAREALGKYVLRSMLAPWPFQTSTKPTACSPSISCSTTGTAADTFTGDWRLPWEPPLHFPARCVSEGFDFVTLSAQARALDIGCAVGRASFELARYCEQVVGIDFSQKFISAAQKLQESGEGTFERLEEGAQTTTCTVRVDETIDRSRVAFETGDAMHLREDLGHFDAVLAANLMCRLPEPALFLQRLPVLVKAGGQLVITTPCTWMEEFTPRENWLCHDACSTLDGLRAHLDGTFELVRTVDLPFLLREHRRKFQLTVAQASVWRRRG